MMAWNVIRVPQGCPTLEKAVAWAVIFSAQKVYTVTHPLEIRLDRGVHEIVGYEDEYGFHHIVLTVTCSHVTFVGKGHDQTTIRGGIFVQNQQRGGEVGIQSLTLMSSTQAGLLVTGQTTTVSVADCNIEDSWLDGIAACDGANVNVTNTSVTRNGRYGVVASDGALVFLRCVKYINNGSADEQCRFGNTPGKTPGIIEHNLVKITAHFSAKVAVT
jgi:hypothetical protein